MLGTPVGMTWRVGLFAFAFLFGGDLTRASELGDVRFELPVSPWELIQDEERFREFAVKVDAQVERLLAVPAAIDDVAVLGRLLAIRVHLAHYFARDERAVSTAAWIRSLQSNPADRAFAGLTTLASVAARRAHPGSAPHEPGYRDSFKREFSRQLAGLPASTEIVAMLRGQRGKIASITAAALSAETRDVIAPALARQGYCGLEGADQLVRVRHRLASILPIREEILAALDAAISERSGR